MLLNTIVVRPRRLRRGRRLWLCSATGRRSRPTVPRSMNAVGWSIRVQRELSLFQFKVMKLHNR